MNLANETPQRACQLCGQTDFETIGTMDRHRQPLHTVICRTCGLVSHAQIPTDSQLADFYTSQYRKLYNGQHTPQEFRVAREWKRSQTRVKRVQRVLHVGDQVFEVGSGLGCTLKQLELAGCQARGIEPGEGFARYSREKLHVEVRQGFLSELPASGDQQLVLLTHVLEHLPRPIEALQLIRRLLAPGGYLYIEVPNLQAPHAVVSRLFHFGHIYNFVPATLIAVAQVAGFRVEQIFSDPLEVEMAILFRADEPSRPTEFSGYGQAMEGLSRYSWDYHLRPSYVWGRWSTMLERVTERVTARRKLNHILALCQSPSDGGAPSGPPAAVAIPALASRDACGESQTSLSR